MVTVVALSVALSACQAGEIVFEQLELAEAVRVVPVRHSSVVCEWRIKGLERPDGLEIAGDRILRALGSSMDAEWEREPKDLLKRYTLDNPGITHVAGKKSTVWYFWDRALRTGWLLVIEPKKPPSVEIPLSGDPRAAQLEEIIVDHFERYPVTRVLPPSHPAVEYEWRIEGLDPHRYVYLAYTSERILKALGTSTDATWEWGGLWFEGRYAWEDPTGEPELMGKKDNVGVAWDLETREGRIVVFDLEKMADSMHQPAK